MVILTFPVTYLFTVIPTTSMEFLLSGVEGLSASSVEESLSLALLFLSEKVFSPPPPAGGSGFEMTECVTLDPLCHSRPDRESSLSTFFPTGSLRRRFTSSLG